jgi:hypothetical protein
MPKVLFTNLARVFGEAKIQQYQLSAAARELPNVNALAPYYIPPCKIIVSSAKGNENFAKLIELIAQSLDCQALDAPAPPPLPRPMDADAPPQKQITIPDPLPYIVVRYPKTEDVQNLPEMPGAAMNAGRIHFIPSQEINEKTAKFREQIADNLLTALQWCGLDVRRSHKAEGSPGWAVDKWAIYIDLGSVQICR